MVRVPEWMSKKKSICSPVRYCLNVDVHVHSGLPRRRANRHSRWRMLPGNTASAPEGSIAAEPRGRPNMMVGGTFPEIFSFENSLIQIADTLSINFVICLNNKNMKRWWSFWRPFLETFSSEKWKSRGGGNKKKSKDQSATFCLKEKKEKRKKRTREPKGTRIFCCFGKEVTCNSGVENTLGVGTPKWWMEREVVWWINDLVRDLRRMCWENSENLEAEGEGDRGWDGRKRERDDQEVEFVLKSTRVFEESLYIEFGPIPRSPS